MAHMVSLLGSVESIREDLQRLSGRCSKVLRSSRMGSQRAGGAQSCSLKIRAIQTSSWTTRRAVMSAHKPLSSGTHCDTPLELPGFQNSKMWLAQTCWNSFHLVASGRTLRTWATSAQDEPRHPGHFRWKSAKQWEKQWNTRAFTNIPWSSCISQQDGPAALGNALGNDPLSIRKQTGSTPSTLWIPMVPWWMCLLNMACHAPLGMSSTTFRASGA